MSREESQRGSVRPERAISGSASDADTAAPARHGTAGGGAFPVCQICGGQLIEIRGKLQCARCHTIWETCCEGGRWE